MKTLIIDKNPQSRESTINCLKNIENIELINSLDDFQSDDINYNEINLIIFDINSKNSNEILEKISFLKSQFNHLNFIALSYEINSNLVNETLKKGVADFLLKPILPSILETSIKKITSTKEKKGKVITIYASKGGIGKTSLITNLAWEIYKQTSDKICILDFTYSSENINSYLNIKQKYGLDYILSNLQNLAEQSFLSLIGKYQDSEIYTIEANEETLPQNSLTTQTITKIINSLKNIFDYILVDTSSTTNDCNISVLNSSNLILLLILGNQTSIKNCHKSYELFDKIGCNNDKIKLIINRFIENQELTLSDIENNLKKEVFATIPNNYLTLIDAINQEKNVDEVNPNSNIAKSYSKIAKDILQIDFEKINSKANFDYNVFNLLKRMGEE